MGCGKSKQKKEESGFPGNIAEDYAGEEMVKLPDYEEPEGAGQEDPEGKFHGENFDKFMEEFLFLRKNVGSLTERQEDLRQKYIQKRNDLLALLGRTRDVLTLNNLSVQEMAKIGTILEKLPPKFEALLTELSELDVDLQPVYDFRDRISDGKQDGMFNIPSDEDIRDAFEELTANGCRLLNKSRSIRFGILELLREIDVSKFWLIVSMNRAHDRDLLHQAKDKLENEVGALKKEKEYLMEERENSYGFMDKLKALNSKLYAENHGLKKSNKELTCEMDSLAHENQRLKATIFDMMMQMEAAKRPKYSKEPDLRTPEPLSDNLEDLSGSREPDLPPEARTDIGPHRALSSGEAVIEKSSLKIPAKEKRNRGLKVGWLPDKSLTQTFAVEKFDYSNVRNSQSPAADSGISKAPSQGPASQVGIREKGTACDVKIPDKNSVSEKLPDPLTAKLPKSEVQDGDDIQGTDDNPQRNKPKNGKFKALFKSFIRRRRSARD